MPQCNELLVADNFHCRQVLHRSIFSTVLLCLRADIMNHISTKYELSRRGLQSRSEITVCMITTHLGEFTNTINHRVIYLVIMITRQYLLPQSREFMSLGNLTGNLLNSYKINFPEVFSQSAHFHSDSMLHVCI
jgi:hypothetical protein